MGMELLTSTDTDRLHERASALLVNMEALRDELNRLDGVTRGLYPGWEGEAADAMYPLWRDWYTAMRETSYITTEAGYTMSRLANELELAQFEYRQQVAAAEAAGFSVRADGMLEQPTATATADPADLARQADEFRLYAYRIAGALAEAEAADRRAADKFGEKASTENPALAAFLKTYSEKAEPLYSALGGSLTTAANGLEQFARRPGVSAADRARALATAQRYRALANNPAFRAANTNVLKRFPALSVAGIPLGYVQNRAQGDDGGEATTKAVVSGGTSIGLGLGAAAGAGWMASLVLAPPVALAVGAGFAIAGSEVGRRLGDAAGPWVHRKLVTPISEDIQELGDNIRDDFWDTLDDLKYYAKNFPRDFREATMG